MAESSVPTQVGPASEEGRLMLSLLREMFTALDEVSKARNLGLISVSDPLPLILRIEQEAAALERRRTVERIRAALGPMGPGYDEPWAKINAALTEVER